MYNVIIVKFFTKKKKIKYYINMTLKLTDIFIFSIDSDF